jgi:hypothetical protein
MIGQETTLQIMPRVPWQNGVVVRPSMTHVCREFRPCPRHAKLRRKMALLTPSLLPLIQLQLNSSKGHYPTGQSRRHLHYPVGRLPYPQPNVRPLVRATRMRLQSSRPRLGHILNPLAHSMATTVLTDLSIRSLVRLRFMTRPRREPRPCSHSPGSRQFQLLSMHP